MIQKTLIYSTKFYYQGMCAIFAAILITQIEYSDYPIYYFINIFRSLATLTFLYHIIYFEKYILTENSLTYSKRICGILVKKYSIELEEIKSIHYYANFRYFNVFWYDWTVYYSHDGQTNSKIIKSFGIEDLDKLAANIAYRTGLKIIKVIEK
jgi:hypothetical protein